MIVFIAGQPTQYSLRGVTAARTIARAASSGAKTGASGRGFRSRYERAQSNCGVLNAVFASYRL